MTESKLFFPNRHGQKLCGVLLNPGASADIPIIIFVHGFTSNKNTKSFSRMIENLAEKNIASFRIDLFGHGESDGAFEDLTTTEAVEDVLQAIRFVKTQGFSRIGLLGSSFGGVTGIMAAAQTHDLFCLGLKSPVSDLYGEEIWSAMAKQWQRDGYIFYTTDDGRKLRLNYSFYDDFKNNDAYRAAAKITIPTLIVHGDADTTVPYGQSEKLSSLIQNSTLYTVKGADHRYTQPAHFDQMTMAFTEFFIRLCAEAD